MVIFFHSISTMVRLDNKYFQKLVKNSLMSDSFSMLK
jgi:hypothetical protein